jgi:hypothetical protein
MLVFQHLLTFFKAHCSIDAHKRLHCSLIVLIHSKGVAKIFTYASNFKTWFVVLVLTIKRSLMQLFWTFNLSSDILATVLATFTKIWQFLKSSGHSALVITFQTGQSRM